MGSWAAGLLLVALSTSAAAGDGALDAGRRTGTGVEFRKMRPFDMPKEFHRLAEVKRLASIERLADLLSRSVTHADQLMVKRAELSYEQGRYRYGIEMDTFALQVEACREFEACDPSGLQPDHSDSKAWHEKSIALYESVLGGFPRHPRADQATFHVGSALIDLGREPEALEALTQVVTTYPESVFVPDAYVQIGDVHLQHHRVSSAMEAYLRASAFPESHTYGYAMYKLGWSYYELGDYDRAIEAMKGVIVHSLCRGDPSTSTRQLQDEALLDLVQFFADANATDEAVEFFGKLGRADLAERTAQAVMARQCK